MRHLPHRLSWPYSLWPPVQVGWLYGGRWQIPVNTFSFTKRFDKGPRGIRKEVGIGSANKGAVRHQPRPSLCAANFDDGDRRLHAYTSFAATSMWSVQL